MKKVFILFLLFFTHVAFAQDYLEAPLKSPFFPADLIESSQIRSLIIYEESKNFEQEPDLSKLMMVKEYEFNDEGRVIYQLDKNTTLLHPFRNVKESDEVIYFRYNDKGLKVSEYIENEYRTIETLSDYDDQQHLVLSETLYLNETIDKISFKWKKGKMIKSKVLYSDFLDEEEEEERIYGEDGRIISYKSYNYNYAYEFHTNGDTTTRIETEFVHDSLSSVVEFSYLDDQESRFTHYLEMDEFGETDKEVFIEYDDSDNITSYDLQEFDRVRQPQEVLLISTRTTYRIENEYNDQGLLVKQLFYLKNKSTQQSELSKVLHYDYSEENLDSKFDKGQIYENIDRIKLR